MNIAKFGGSILKNHQDVVSICEMIRISEPSVNVISAFYGITDTLILAINSAKDRSVDYQQQIREMNSFHYDICTKLGIEPGITHIHTKLLEKGLDLVFQTSKISPKTHDSIITYGEMMSSTIIHSYIIKIGIKALLLDATQVIKTDSNFGSANIDNKSTARKIKKHITRNTHYIIAGFIGSNRLGERSILGRNGSDYTASTIGNIIKSQKITIWKEFNGIFTADPKLITQTEKISKISYSDAQILSYFGNKVVCPKALVPAIEQKITIIIKSISNPSENGTTISDGIIKSKCITKLDDICNISIISKLNYNNEVAIHNISKAIKGILNNYIVITESLNKNSISLYIKSSHYNMIAEQLSMLPNISIQTKKQLSIIAITGLQGNEKNKIIGEILCNLHSSNIETIFFSYDHIYCYTIIVINAENSEIGMQIIYNTVFGASYKQ